MDKDLFEKLLKEYQEKKISVPEEIQKGFSKKVLEKLDAPSSFNPAFILFPLLFLACLAGFLFFQHTNRTVPERVSPVHEHRDVLSEEEMPMEKKIGLESEASRPHGRDTFNVSALPKTQPETRQNNIGQETEAGKSEKTLTPEEEIELIFENLEEEELLDLLAEMEGADFLLKLGGPFLADDTEILEAFEVAGVF